jgi:hypothetical protein
VTFVLPKHSAHQKFFAYSRNLERSPENHKSHVQEPSEFEFDLSGHSNADGVREFYFDEKIVDGISRQANYIFFYLIESPVMDPPPPTNAIPVRNGNSENDRAGSRNYCGTPPNSYSKSSDIEMLLASNGKDTYNLKNLTSGQTYYFAVSAYHSSSTEGNRPNETSDKVT